MEKKLLWAFILALAVIVGYSRLMVKLYPPPGILEQEQPAEIFPERAISVEKREAFSQTRTQPQPAVNEKVITYNTKKYEILISNIGGAIKRINLKDYTEADTKEPMKLAELVNSPGMLSLIRMNGDDLSRAVYEVTQEQNAVLYRYLVPDKFEIIKKYYFPADRYDIELEITINNLAPQTEEYQYRIVGGAGIDVGGNWDKRLVELDAIINGGLKRDRVRRASGGGLVREGDILWAGLQNRYFSIIIKPLAPVSARASFYNLVEEDKLQTGIDIAPFLLSSGSGVTHSFLLYAGPNDYDNLNYYNFRFDEIVNFGVFGSISKILLVMMKFFYRLISNWGIAIILITLLISLLLYPLTWKSLKSMREMQAIQPEINNLRQTNKDKPQKLNREIMELYRKHKINPLGGCLPLLFQTPIFIALYQTLIRSIELKGARFLWIQDLSRPDAMPLPFSLPLLGNALNILPVLMSAAMFVQQKISQPGGHAQTEQQKQMVVFMPVLFGIIFYNLPSGLVLYWLTNTVLTITYQGIAKKGHL